MLDISPSNMRTEIETAIKLRRRHTNLTNELIQRYAGQHYREDWTPEMPSHENHEFELVVNTIPAVIARNPKVKITSRRPVSQRELAEGMTHGMNRWIKDVHLKDKLIPIVHDSLFNFGVAITLLETAPGYDGQDMPPLRPALKHLRPTRFFMDPQCDGPMTARYKGHLIIRDREDLLKAKTPDGRPKYNREAIEALTAPDSHNEMLDDPMFRDMELLVDRGQVVYAEVFVPEHGAILTIGFGGGADKKQKAVYLRKPRRIYGDPRGPYTMFGYYIVPGQVYPLPPLAVTAAAVEEVNAHAEQVSRQADTARNLVLVNANNPAMVDAVKNFEDGTVAAVPGFNPQDYAQISLGGPLPTQIDYIQYLRERIDRRSGLTDIQRGNVTGEATATEAKLAAAASSGRVRWMQERVREGVCEVLEKAAWLMFNSDSVVFPLKIEDTERLLFTGLDQAAIGANPFRLEPSTVKEGVFYGGVQPGQEDANFADLELEIEPYSMEEVNEVVLQKRMQDAFTLITNAAPMIMQIPFVNWPALLDDYFQVLNIPDGRKYINWDMVSQLMGLAFQAGGVMGIPGIDGTPMTSPKRLPSPHGSATSGTGGAGQETGALLANAVA